MHNDGLLWPQAVAKATEELKCGARTLAGSSFAGGAVWELGLQVLASRWRDRAEEGRKQKQKQREFVEAPATRTRAMGEGCDGDKHLNPIIPFVGVTFISVRPT